MGRAGRCAAWRGRRRRRRRRRQREPPANDPAIEQKYTDAAASYKKGIDLNAASKKPNPETAAAAYNQLGQALARAERRQEATDAYDEAAKADPTNAGMYYFNEAATLYNAGKLDEAGAAADKAIAADPKRATPTTSRARR